MAKLTPCCPTNVRVAAVKLMTSYVALLWIVLIVVDGSMVAHRKDEVPGHVVSHEVRGLSPEMKKDKKGISVNLVNIIVDDDQSDADSSLVSSGTSGASTGTAVSSSEQCRSVAEKVDCASYGVTAAQCQARGCCYSEIRDGPDPWCYLPETSLVSQCQGREESRLQCGYYNIESDECNKLGCCWRPTSTSGTPWCYHADDSNSTRPGDEAESNHVDQCGVTPIEPDVNLRIVGGVEAVPHSWPWMVSLQQGDGHNCGGSLINDRWVISAAHCHGMFQNLNESSVVIGVHSLDSPDPTFTERIRAEKIIVHSKFLRPDNMISNDIMLIRLARPVSFSNAVRPICLPRHHQTIESGTRCWSTGWGFMIHGSGIGSNVLNQVALPILDTEVCNQPDWYNGEVDDTMVCAGYQEGGRGACHGDSGGSLACHVDGRWVLYGIVSWGGECAGENKPANFARTSAYIKWIQRQMRDNSD